jgi:hypothetical protein
MLAKMLSHPLLASLSQLKDFGACCWGSYNAIGIATKLRSTLVGLQGQHSHTPGCTLQCNRQVEWVGLDSLAFLCACTLLNCGCEHC